jgi:hypothetical protein
LSLYIRLFIDLSTNFALSLSLLTWPAHESHKKDDKAKRKAEVRARLEQAAAAKKKKGFMTPARKKKLRVRIFVWPSNGLCNANHRAPLDYAKQGLLRKKAAEELKREQERKAEQRRKIIRERTGQPKNLEDANERQYNQSIDRDSRTDLDYEMIAI